MQIVPNCSLTQVLNLTKPTKFKIIHYNGAYHYSWHITFPFLCSIKFYELIIIKKLIDSVTKTVVNFLMEPTRVDSNKEWQCFLNFLVNLFTQATLRFATLPNNLNPLSIYATLQVIHFAVLYIVQLQKTYYLSISGKC